MNKILALVFMFLVAGCNTVQGLGQDIKKVGEKMESAAKK
jgi:predicted small secreted protein